MIIVPQKKAPNGDPCHVEDAIPANYRAECCLFFADRLRVLLVESFRNIRYGRFVEANYSFDPEHSLGIRIGQVLGKLKRPRRNPMDSS